jgi:hypothetical protein
MDLDRMSYYLYVMFNLILSRIDTNIWLNCDGSKSYDFMILCVYFMPR